MKNYDSTNDLNEKVAKYKIKTEYKSLKHFLIKNLSIYGSLFVIFSGIIWCLGLSLTLLSLQLPIIILLSILLVIFIPIDSYWVYKSYNAFREYRQDYSKLLSNLKKGSN